LELVAGVALLVLPVALVVLALPEWSSRQALARLAARDAARAATLAGWCDPAASARAVDQLARAAGLPAGALRVVLDCADGASLPRDGSVTARVTVSMPAITVPMVGAVPGWSWTAVHREPVDPYGSRP
jgi:hypothetical protein